VKRSLSLSEKQVFFIMLGELAGTHGLLPTPMIITDGIEVSRQVIAAGSLADVRTGILHGHIVAVKSLRVPPRSDLSNPRKVGSKTSSSRPPGT